VRLADIGRQRGVLKALATEVLGLSNLREVLSADNASSRRLLDELRASAPSW